MSGLHGTPWEGIETWDDLDPTQTHGSIFDSLDNVIDESDYTDMDYEEQEQDDDQDEDEEEEEEEEDENEEDYYDGYREDPDDLYDSDYQNVVVHTVPAEYDSDGDVSLHGSHPLLEIMALLNAGNGLSAEARDALLNRIARSGSVSFSNPRQYVPEDRYKRLFEPQAKPDARGVELLRSGDFGDVGPWRSGGRSRPSERRGWRKHGRGQAATHAVAPTVPNNSGTVVAEYPGVRAYLGQYAGPDYGTFYSATQDFQLYLYDTKKSASDDDPAPAVVGREEDDTYDDMWGYRHSRGRQITSMKQIKTVRGVHGNWTITDADADRKAERMIYSSITPLVHMFKTAEHDEDHQTLDFRTRPHEDFSIWSIRFSADGKEVVAGTGRGGIMVYDLESERRILKVDGHKDDVNSVCFADTGSTNVLVSGSDDGFVKVWDRRSLSSSTPSGVLPGATQGITYVSPKGDGRYIVANSKDQAARLYDLRKMRQWSEFEEELDAVVRWGDGRFDYRRDKYRSPKRLAHPRDCSVMTFRGHSVLRTLIRCHFSPVESTGQRYIYSGSADGLIHIWSLDGRVVQVLDRDQTMPLGRNASGKTYNDPSAPSRPLRRGSNMWVPGKIGNTVRDVAWHGYEPTLMSTCWEAGGQHSGGGTVAKHEWKGLGKGGLRSLEDWVGKTLEDTKYREAGEEW